jgi:hypothetical protein
MLLEPDERRETETDVAHQIRQLVEQSDARMLLAEEGGEIVGYVEADGGRYRRNPQLCVRRDRYPRLRERPRRCRSATGSSTSFLMARFGG